MEKNIIVITNHADGSKAMEVVNYSNANMKIAIAALLDIAATDIILLSSSMSGGIFQVTKEYRGLEDDLHDTGLGRFIVKTEFAKLSPMPEYIPARFHIGDERSHEGVYNPAVVWNGYAVPYFTQEVADTILRGTSAHYKFDRLKFIIEEEEGEDIVYEAVNINGKHMYAIGGYFWTWEIEEDEEEDDTTQYLNYYRCPGCKAEWTDQWSAMCDDQCPECGKKNISPYDSEEIDNES